jgi:hypothetical protein
VNDELVRFREAAEALLPLEEGARRVAFGELIGTVLPRLEARARETSDASQLIDCLSEIWQIGYDIGVVSIPPPR